MLNTKALAASASAAKVYVEDVFSTWLYTGNGSTQTITNGIDLSGKGGLLWTKSRTSAYAHALFDTGRGAGSILYSNSTAAQGTGFGQAFTSTGFSFTNGGTSYNSNTEPYASWTFRKQAKFFDVITYNGNGSNRTIAHNLGSVPGCVIVKQTSAAGQNWIIYHRGLTNPEQKYLLFNTAAAGTLSTIWNNTAPTSTVFTVGTDISVNQSGESYVAYLFAHDAGGFGDSGNDSVVKCGSHSTTSGSVATVDLGWEPQWLLWKVASSSGFNWYLVDNMRGFNPSGVAGNRLLADSGNAEAALPTASINLTSTGFTVDGTWAGTNTSCVYIAIRRGPMKTPTDATKVFAATAYTGTGSLNAKTTGFPVDGMFSKWRSGNNVNALFNRLTSADKYLDTGTTGAEASTTSTGALKIDSNTGFTWTVNDAIGNSTVDYINYSFRRAPGFFDVVAYTGTGVARTVNHSLGVVPELMIVKIRNASGYEWFVYHSFLGNTNYLNLNLTSASASASTVWNNTSPTTTNFTVGTASAVNLSTNTFIAYLLATCPGVSKVGSYTGTGTTKDIDCGFTNGARFVLIKRTDSTGTWYVWDTARGIVSGNDPYLLLNSTAAEVTNTDYIDPLSSGFQISSTAPAAINANGGSYIFLAIA
jgi:hypothetical protein